MERTTVSLPTPKLAPRTAPEPRDLPVIFGLRYLEEEAAEIHDVIGCELVAGSCTYCDDVDYVH